MITLSRQRSEDQQPSGRMLLTLLDVLATAAWKLANDEPDPAVAAIWSGLACELSDHAQIVASKLQEITPQ